MEALQPNQSVAQNQQVQTSELPETLAAAIFLHRQGLALLPIRPRSKRTHKRVLTELYGDDKWGHLARRRASEPEVTAWFEKDPECGIAVIAGPASGGLGFVDVDDPDAAYDLVVRLARLGGPVIRTPRPGYRFLFRQREPIPNRKLKLPDGREVGEVITGYNRNREVAGQYALVPPSIHPSGQAYAWHRGFNAPLPELDEAELLKLLDGFVAGGRAHAEAAADADAEARAFDGGDRRKYERCQRSYLRRLDQEGTARIYELQRSPEFIKAALRLLGLADMEPCRSFRCVLPGHDDERQASATLFQLDDGSVMYCDWHERGEARWYSLAEVYHAQVTGKVCKLSPPTHATWILRLAVDAGVIEPAHVEAPEPPAKLPAPARKLYAGFLKLLAVKWLHSPGHPTTFSWKFAADWCGISERQVRKWMPELLRMGLIRTVGEHKPARGRPQTLFLSGLVAHAGGVKDAERPARPWVRRAVKHVLRAARAQKDKPAEPCAKCGGTRFWRLYARKKGEYPQWICDSCLPAPHGAVEWCEVSAPPPS